MINFRLWLENINIITAFHQTDPQSAQSIMQHGFDLRFARKYVLGKGVYLSIKPKKAVMDGMVDIECQVNIAGFLLLNYSQTTDQRKQEILKIWPNIDPQSLEIVSSFNFGGNPDENQQVIPLIMSKFRGIVQTEYHYLVVAYHPEDVKPIKIINATKFSN